MSGKMMRACDCCLRKRARWYCLADDAFLCQKCDGLVHSANPFARRHDRVRLKNISFKSSTRPNLPSWHRGSTRKPRTPRKSGLQRSKSEESTNPDQNQLYAVPELEVDETTSSHDDEADDNKLIHLVPTLDPLGSEICSSTSTSSGPTMEVEGSSVVMSHMMGMATPQDEYLPSDLYLDQFAADVETLLGKGLDDEEPYGIEELGLLDCCNNTTNQNDDNTPVDFLKAVKAENNDQSGTMSNKEGDMMEVYKDDVANKEPFDFSFDNCDDDHDGDDQKGGYFKALMENFNEGDDNCNDLLCKLEEEEENGKEVEIKTRKIILRLDYEAISEAWASQGSPWINGQRPQINHDDYWPHCMGTSGVQMMHNPLHLDQEMGGVGVINDGGREARVSRYREKRRTRLFAKKIRYEVRKLNAEKRPRMKGRFVKRSSFASSASPSNTICI